MGYNPIALKQITRDFLEEKKKQLDAIDKKINNNIDAIDNMRHNIRNEINTLWFQDHAKHLIKENNILHDEKSKLEKSINKWEEVVNSHLAPFSNTQHINQIEPSHNKRKNILDNIMKKYVSSEEYEKCVIIRDLILEIK